ncbi:MAG: ankyrin repeat domain-containing protein [Endozoicomonadaceae bacterium]|nr:ankyrin repeat domain-containing protein [Endozoicomonadaceae bacterium]
MNDAKAYYKELIDHINNDSIATCLSKLNPIDYKPLGDKLFEVMSGKDNFEDSRRLIKAVFVESSPMKYVPFKSWLFNQMISSNNFDFVNADVSLFANKTSASIYPSLVKSGHHKLVDAMLSCLSADHKQEVFPRLLIEFCRLGLVDSARNLKDRFYFDGGERSAALNAACHANQMATAEMFLSPCEIPSALLKGILQGAVINENYELVNLLLNGGSDINEMGNLPLREACMQNLPNMVSFLIARCAKPNHCENNYYPLTTALTFGSLDCVKVLLESGADPTLCFNDCLNRGITSGFMSECIEMLNMLGQKLVEEIYSSPSSWNTEELSSTSKEIIDSWLLSCKLSPAIKLPDSKNDVPLQLENSI